MVSTKIKYKVDFRLLMREMQGYSLLILHVGGHEANFVLYCNYKNAVCTILRYYPLSFMQPVLDSRLLCNPVLDKQFDGGWIDFLYKNATFYSILPHHYP